MSITLHGSTAFRGCRFCHGRGCIGCAAEMDKAYRAHFPDGPKPLATFRLDDPKDMEAARETISAEAIQKAFGPEGKGMFDFIDGLRRVGKLEE